MNINKGASFGKRLATILDVLFEKGNGTLNVELPEGSRILRRALFARHCGQRMSRVRIIHINENTGLHTRGDIILWCPICKFCAHDSDMW